MSNDLDSSLPPVTLAAGFDGASVTVPAITLACGPDGLGATLPAITLDALLIDSGGTLEAALPAITLSAAGITGGAASASLTIPALVLDAGTGYYALLEVPAPTLTATLIAGGTAVGAGSLPMPRLTAVHAQENLLTGGGVVPAPRLTAAMVTSGLGTLSLTVPVRTLTASGVSGNAATAALTIPVILLAASGYPAGEGSMSAALPMWRIEADAWRTITAAYRAWALNTRREALTEYDNFEFNSLAVFKGRVLAAGPGGLVELGTQDTDAGDPIAALVRTGKDDFGTSYNKRVPRLYVGLKADGDMEFRTLTTQDGTRAYLLPDNGNADVQQRRVPVGRGPKSRFWQFEVANRGGADFLLVDLQPYPETTGRRVV